MLKIKGITKRWVINTLGVIIALLVMIAVSASVAIRNSYYDMVSTALNSRSSDLVLTYFNLYTEHKGIILPLVHASLLRILRIKTLWSLDY